MEKKDKLYISLYNDYYGGMLTEHQRDLVSMYYDQDMSLSEIGQSLGISPQGVRDTLKRAENSLVNCEAKLGLVAKTVRLRSLLQQLAPLADEAVQDEIHRALEMLDN